MKKDEFKNFLIAFIRSLLLVTVTASFVVVIVQKDVPYMIFIAVVLAFMITPYINQLQKGESNEK